MYAMVGALLVGLNAAAQALGANPEWSQVAMWASMLIGLAMKMEAVAVVQDATK